MYRDYINQELVDLEVLKIPPPTDERPIKPASVAAFPALRTVTTGPDLLPTVPLYGETQTPGRLGEVG